MTNYKYYIALFVLTIITPLALAEKQPKPERAQVLNLQADLLLPQGSMLSVNLDMDCNSRLATAGAFSISDHGTRIIAAGLKALYGEHKAQQALTLWHNKAHQDDPRKPSFLIVLENKENVYSDDTEPKDNLPGVTILGFCGVNIHAK